MNRTGITENMSHEDERNLRVKGLISGMFSVIIMGIILFLSSGTLKWPMAWVILIAVGAATVLVTLFCSPDLIVERMNKQAGAKDWDMRMVRVMNLFGLLPLLVAGLDMRFGWTGQIPISVQAVALGIFILGYVIFSWAMLTNRFFSLVVRIQDEKGHRTVTTGPYRFVRHPGYLGFFLIVITQPLVLGSLYALLPALITAALFVVRTKREDDTLFRELNGYLEYSNKVRYRLIPGIW
ncbi:Isoprenylcysteine carboxyl methyltransferase [Methanolacinia petrolearia DSM 11571]|uniref:Isoprenylcysteine carboxyl methyltransferase n=2 Tax=Methanolacinia TaxID=230355 RepID=E1RH89_METP4|nr:Isoprenylcysteine carboxyl methyltransferase [Methanolacinia petrolearia DSM 11571]